MNGRTFHGIYPGRVANNVDPLNMARIQVSIADVTGSTTSTWALPCLPVTGRGMGAFTVPPVGSAVWIMFANGDIDYPVWMGGYYANGDAPSLSRKVPPSLDGITLQTTSGHGLLISDAPGGGILIQTAGGAKIEVTDAGITIATGQGAEIKLTGSMVNVNNNALTVT